MKLKFSVPLVFALALMINTAPALGEDDGMMGNMQPKATDTDAEQPDSKDKMPKGHDHHKMMKDHDMMGKQKMKAMGKKDKQMKMKDKDKDKDKEMPADMDSDEGKDHM